MHFIKVKGTDKIPDFIQIRDNDFKLIAYFSTKNIKKGLERNNLSQYLDTIEKLNETADFSEIIKIEE
jgi:hypothetical protein